MKLPWTKEEEKEPSSEPEGTETKVEEGKEEKKKVESSSETPPMDTEGVQSPFDKDGPLAGKSEKEVADMLALQDMTIKEQSAAVDGIGSQPAVAVEPEPEPKLREATSEEFFANPGKEMNDAISAGVQSQMKEIVAELRLEMAEGRTKTAWDEAKESIPNLDNMRPLIEARLKQNGVANPNKASIIAVNDMLVGEATRQGTQIPGTGTTPVPTPKPVENERAIPQHAVSTQPLVQTETKEKFEPLDENEARVARENKMTPEQFRRWQALDGEDVLLPAPEKVS